MILSPATPDLRKNRPPCLFAHGLVNKMSVIVGYCDLLKEHTTPEGSVGQKQLQAIREIAKAVAKELIDFQCQMDVVTREMLSKTRPTTVNSPMEIPPV
jgi:hypothetical protein